MSKLIALFYYFIFVSVIFGRITKSGFLLLGGRGDNFNSLDTVEVYSYDLPKNTSLPSLPFPLYNHIAEMTESGAIFVAGGRITNNISDKTLMLSSLSSSKWEEVEARMPIPVCKSASVVVGDIVLVLGGRSDLDNYGRDVIQMLNTNKSLPTWKLLNQTLPLPLSLHSAAVYEDQIIILTMHGVTFTTSVSSIISDMELDWKEGKLPGVEEDVPVPGLEVVEGKLVAVLGRKVFTKTTMASQLDSHWVQLEPLPHEKSDCPSIGSVWGSIVIGGGLDVLDNTGVSDAVFMWMEASSEWGEVKRLKIRRHAHATVQLPRFLEGTTIITQAWVRKTYNFYKQKPISK